ncbi:hypothetical protein PoB_004644100 [Plakobranchus ocellatus]|uniref:Uncharacterized protein n=1 Tax=Plakobranchus ocellatus TaxID=259542 RepID=A0AAV4BLQ2_9GAST|nr:hypothetical protein PoB_004644100 [Plakobranchus ocellatus]
MVSDSWYWEITCLKYTTQPITKGEGRGEVCVGKVQSLATCDTVQSQGGSPHHCNPRQPQPPPPPTLPSQSEDVILRVWIVHDLLPVIQLKSCSIPE